MGKGAHLEDGWVETSYKSEKNKDEDDKKCTT